MNKQNVMGKIEDKRLLNINEVCTYIGIGQTQARKVMQEIGAVRRFGRRILYDKIAIDTSLASMGVDKENWLKHLKKLFGIADFLSRKHQHL